MTRRGVTLAELVMAIGLVAMLAVPLLALLSASDHEAMTSEDYMLAEAVALRHLDELSATPWQELARTLPIERKLAGLPAGDEALAAKYPEYTRLFGADGFTGKLTARWVDEGLAEITVTLGWTARPAGSRRSYGLVRMRGRPDHAIRRSYPFGEAR